MGVSTKGGDEERFCRNVQKYAREGVLVRANCAIDPAGGSFTNQETGEPFSATNMRRAIANRSKELTSFIPPEAHDRMDDIEDILAMNESKVKEPITLENLFNMVEEIMEEDEENIEEISAMGAGAVAGAGNGLDPAKRDPWEKW